MKAKRSPVARRYLQLQRQRGRTALKKKKKGKESWGPKTEDRKSVVKVREGSEGKRKKRESRED